MAEDWWEAQERGGTVIMETIGEVLRTDIQDVVTSENTIRACLVVRFDNGLVEIVRRLMATGLLLRDDSESTGE
ncbi:hypothetical protein [Haloarcula sp. Atlit-120R]|uniref:hypothetical protein n=1 Tax=Haloarcula sp. Atlit-120R TaxID=2282135 RepID=UPI000EF18D86|nr:hypothetical protein [Haloarcula sp. Atlit-120R]RLM32984.1 hypothetical protein DVK01_18865 [Haloarcula sp. Atlit-120R]